MVHTAWHTRLNDYPLLAKKTLKPESLRVRDEVVKQVFVSYRDVGHETTTEALASPIMRDPSSVAHHQDVDDDDGMIRTGKVVYGFANGTFLSLLRLFV